MISGPMWLVANPASGSNDETALEGLLAAFAAAGLAPDRIIDATAHDLPGRNQLEQAQVATLAVFTGDGTLNAVVPPLEGWTGNVLVLPGGTANLFAKALHGDQSADRIVAGFAAGRLAVRRRACIRSSQGPALVEILAGPGATWSEVREGMREGALGETASLAIEAVRQTASGPMVAVTDPPLGRPEGYAGLRVAVSGSGMGVAGYAADSVADYLKHGVALIRRDFREGPHEELGDHDEIVCRSADGSPIALMIDGERRTGAGTERFSLAPLAVNLLGSAGV